VAYTRRLDANDLDDLRGVDVTAHQLQDWVDKDHEARVVVVGDQVFGVAIRAHNDRARVDWRADFDALTYDPVTVPAPVEKGVRRYMQTLGLQYAAFDFCIDRNRQWIFLEANTAGQYAWLEAATDTPISAALVDLLARGHAHD
jgi:glutathione synthase/RimK-type ligase-like ATP-grasp enzyme